LNLPAFEAKTRTEGDQTYIWDVVRRKYVIVTPEEWVRQHFINFLISYHHIPRTLLRVEGGLKVNNMLKRSDLLVLDRRGNSWMLVECKSPKIKLTQDAFVQTFNYNKTHQAPYVALTNGLTHLICNVETGKPDLLTDFPAYPID